MLFGKVVGCAGFQRKRVFFQGRPFLRPLSNCTFFSKQEPCSLSQVSAAMSQAWVEQLRAKKALTAIKTPVRGLARQGGGQNMRFPTSLKQSPCNERHTVKTLTSPFPWHNPQIGLDLGERAKIFPLISFKNIN